MFAFKILYCAIQPQIPILTLWAVERLANTYGLIIYKMMLNAIHVKI